MCDVEPKLRITLSLQLPLPFAPDLGYRMIKHFNYYDDWRSAELECPKCHWKGKFGEGSVEHYSELQDCSCPRCDFDASPTLAKVSYPTLDEMLASGNPADVQRARRIKQSQQKFDAAKLTSDTHRWRSGVIASSTCLIFLAMR
jgi:hypothetical protein